MRIYLKRKILAYFFITFFAIFSYLFAVNFSNLGLSPLVVAVFLGAIVANFYPKLTTFAKKTAALQFSTKQILRLGIILYGFKITISDLSLVGFRGILASFIVVFSTILLGIFIGKVLKFEWRDSVLIACGSAICGAAAVLSAQSVLKSSAQKTAISVCLVVVFGTIAMFLYPFLLKFGNFSDFQSGFIAGLGIHEVAQVVVAGSALGALASKIAVIVKMLRVLMLVPFLIVLNLANSSSGFSLSKSVPWFAVVFLLVIFLNGFLALDSQILNFIATIDNILLSMAMFALGLTLQKSIFKSGLGKSLLMALLLMIWLVFISGFLGIYLV